jgi:hypothetical protein
MSDKLFAYQTAGDVVDRATILMLKVAMVEDLSKRAQAFRELCEIAGTLNTVLKDPDNLVSMGSFVGELYDINGDLWEIEEQIRMDISNERKLELLTEIHRLNKERHHVKNAINFIVHPGHEEVKDYQTGSE